MLWRKSIPILLKQTSPVRFFIAVAEDTPRGLLMLAFALRQGTTAFVTAGFTLSAIRIIFAGPFAHVILSSLRAERQIAANSSNAFKVLSLTKLIWTTSPEDCATDLPRF